MRFDRLAVEIFRIKKAGQGNLVGFFDRQLLCYRSFVSCFLFLVGRSKRHLHLLFVRV